MNFIANHWGFFLGLLGGVSGLIGFALKGVRPTIHWAIQKALVNPEYRGIILTYRAQIEAFFDSVDAQVKEDLDNAK